MEENIASIIRHGETSRVQFKLNFTSQKEIAREIWVNHFFCVARDPNFCLQ